MTEQHNDHALAAVARAQHHAPTDPPMATPPTGDRVERSAVGDFAYQVGVNLAAGASVAGLVAGAKVIADKVTGGGGQGRDGKDPEGH